VAVATEALRADGSAYTERLLPGTAWMSDESLGRGRVVLFPDDPNYRMLWPPLSRLFVNAIVLGPSVP